MTKPIVLIVNWTTPDDLDRCLISLRSHEGDVHVSIFQNYDSKETADRSYAIARHHGASFVNHPENLGHGTGINRLAARAKSTHDYFFIVNPDVVWTEPVIDTLIGFLEEDPERCMVGPKQLNSKGEITAAGIFGTLTQPEHRDFKRPDQRNQLHRDIVQATVVAGSALMISVDDFYRYGPMLEAKHYYSETWMCYHAIAHGKTNWYYGEVSMIHDWHRSSPLGFPGTDGKFKEDRELFRHMCDTHDPPIPHD